MDQVHHRHAAGRHREIEGEGKEDRGTLRRRRQDHPGAGLRKGKNISRGQGNWLISKNLGEAKRETTIHF